MSLDDESSTWKNSAMDIGPILPRNIQRMMIHFPREDNREVSALDRPTVPVALKISKMPSVREMFSIAISAQLMTSETVKLKKMMAVAF